ncbi:mucin-associated surface protein (MASP) [Trypanosoma conorhini]|uniref:Mucin-associated surface protein (MASP) n=1 Tax=Trypanosoma conorhini TaxID=83891 RepID=A0A422N0B0_9TRYP|nr:mucin-associated surface protein (MASP) [Trypanosoma conorhini]RNE98898.1 mucin-associated surface protein (MASP) [Trypanosoma conorhini]
MAGRALLVCALCVLCCAAGGGWAAEGNYCTKRDWRDLRAVAKDMSDAEIAAKYCGLKPAFVRGLRASLQGDEVVGDVSDHGGGSGGVGVVADGGPAQTTGAKGKGVEEGAQRETHGAEVSREEASAHSGEHGGLGGSLSREKELSPSPSGETEGHSPSGAPTGVKAAEGQLRTSLGGPGDAETSQGKGQTDSGLQGPPQAVSSTGPDGQRTVQEEKTVALTPEEVPPTRADASARQGDEHTQALKNTSDANAQQTTEIAHSGTPDVAAGSPQVEEPHKELRKDTTGPGVVVPSAATAGQTEGSPTLTKPPTSTEEPGETVQKTALEETPLKEKSAEEIVPSDDKDGVEEEAKPKEDVPAPAVTSDTPDGKAVDAPQPTAPSGGGGTSGEQTGKKAEAIAEDSAGPVAAAAPGAQQQGVAAAGAPTSSDKEPPPAAEDTATEASHAATTTDGGSGSSPAAQPQPASSVVTNEAGQTQQKEQPAVPTSQSQAETSGERGGEAAQSAAGEAAQAATTNNSTSAAKAAPGDSDGSSTAATRPASPLALLLLLACAAAAAMVAA